MKILHFVHNFPPESVGGTETYVKQLAMLQLLDGHEVLVACGSDRIKDQGPYLCRESLNDIPVIRFFKRNQSNLYALWPKSRVLSEDIIELLKNLKPDLVHVHHWQHFSDDLVRLAKKRGIPVVATLHDFFFSCPRFFRREPEKSFICSAHTPLEACCECARKEGVFDEALLMESLEQRRKNMVLELEAASHVTTFSKSVVEFIKAMPGFSKIVVHRLPIGLMRPLAANGFHRFHQPLRIVNWGGQIELKGTHLLLEAISRKGLKDRVEAHIFGKILDHEYESRLLELSKGCNVTFYGPFPEEKKASLGSRFDLAVFPTLAFETYSIVVDEALALGLPVITTQPGAQGERVGAAGLVTPAGDGDVLAAAIESILEIDPKTLRQARLQAVKKIGLFEDHWEGLSRVYGGLVSNCPSQNQSI